MNGDYGPFLERIAVALERIADKYAPKAEAKTPRPATLTDAVYKREEREIRDFKAKARPQGDIIGPARTNL